MKLLTLDLIGNYKGLSEQSFDLSRAAGNVSAFIGTNGSGKSQLMELIVEVFAFLERSQRRDFRVRSSLGFCFRVWYEFTGQQEGGVKQYTVHLSESGQLQVLRRSPIHATDMAQSSELTEWGLDEACDLMDLPLPRLIGYASGLNENLQRAFLRNAVQYFDVMTVRARRREQLSRPDVDERIVEMINHRSRKRYPGIFGDVSQQNSENPLRTDEADTALPIGVFLDYDCTSLLVACLGLLSEEERNELWSEVPFRHPGKSVLRYDLRNVPVEEDGIRDIEQLIRALGAGSVSPLSHRTSDEELERYGLDYLHADILLDLADADVVASLLDTYGHPARLFWKLYKLQLLGVKNWATDVKRSLRDDGFQGHVKKPLKGKLPLAIIELQMSDGNRVTSIDDLSDGEAQLLYTIGAVRLFGDSESLFVFDEPETHLNPGWRTRYHIDLNRAGHGFASSQAFISSHSPFLISSLPETQSFTSRNWVAVQSCVRLRPKLLVLPLKY